MPRQLWLDERGTSGDLADLVVRCECKKSRGMHEATILDLNPLGTCRGARPWLGRHAHEPCNQHSRLLIRTASNAYFPQVVSVLSLPDRGTAVHTAVKDLWDDLQIVDAAADLAFLKKKPRIAEQLAPFTDDEVLVAIGELKRGRAAEKPVKQVELEALLAAPEGFGDDVPVDPDFHARRLPEHVWRRSVTQTKLMHLRYPAIVWSLDFSPDGRWLVSTHGDGAILLWDAVERRLIANFNEHSGPVRAVAFGPDSKEVASVSEDRSVILWDAETGRRQATLMGPHALHGVALAHDGRWLATVDFGSRLKRWEIARKEPSWDVPLDAMPYAVAISPDDRWIATNSGVYSSRDGRRVVDFTDLQGLDLFTPDLRNRVF